MNLTKAQLLQVDHFHLDDDLILQADDIKNLPEVISLKKVHVIADGNLDEQGEKCFVHLDVKGDMILHDAITNEPIHFDLISASDEIYSFVASDEDDVRIVENEIDLKTAILDIIQLAVPIQVTKAREDEYPEGEGWKVYSEAAYQQSRKDEVDPRLAKLKELKEQD